MKRLIIAAMLLVSTVSFAQDKNNTPKKGENFRERMQAEKIAFLTQRLELSVDEAQVFWPVYNKIEEQKRADEKATREAYRALMDGLKNGAADKDIAALTNTYVKAKTAAVDAEEGYVKEYSKVLPAQKVAKLVVSEERFRREQINSLRGGHGGPQGAKPGMKQGQHGQHGPRPVQDGQSFAGAPTQE